jgi:hypothetical protein
MLACPSLKRFHDHSREQDRLTNSLPTVIELHGLITGMIQYKS